MKKLFIFLWIIIVFISCINKANNNEENKSIPTDKPIAIEDIEYDEEIELLNIKLLGAARRGEIDKIKELIEMGADINYQEDFDGFSVLLVACFHQQYDTIKFLIKHGTDVNASDNEGFTPLFSVTNKKNIELLKLMIEKGADVNATTIYGSTPLVSTVGQNNIEGVKILLKHGAKVNFKYNAKFDIYEEPEYKTILQLAKENDYKEIIQLLIEAGAEE